MRPSLSIILAGGLGIAVAACAKYDLGTSGGELRSGPDGTYTFKTIADAVYADESASAEAQRREVMASVAADNRLCASAGYDVIKRETFIRSKGALGDVKDVIYTLRCR